MKPDSEFDREIRALLDVDPSSQFTARVRSRIERAPAPAWQFRWTLYAAGAMAAAIVLVIVVNRSPQRLPDTPKMTTALDIPVKAEAPTPVAVAPVAPTLKTAKKPKEPEFFISPGEAAAMQRLFRNGSVEQTPMVVVTIEPQPLPETHLTFISMSEAISAEPSTTVVTPKGDSQ
jgi:hypothetical protein